MSDFYPTSGFYLYFYGFYRLTIDGLYNMCPSLINDVTKVLVVVGCENVGEGT